MRNVLLLLLGAILIGILSYFCFMDKADTIKDDLVSKAKSAYAAKQMSFVNANLKGEDLELTNTLKLTGTVPSVEMKNEASKIALGIEGIEGVDNQLKVAAIAAVVPEVVIPKVIEPISPKVVIPSPYILTATKDEQNKVILNGYTPNENTHKEIVDIANTLFGSTNVTDKLKEVEGAPPKFTLTAKLGLEKLNDVDYGEFEIADTNFDFRGYVGVSQKKDDILKALKSKLSSNYKANLNIKAPKAVAKPTPTPAPKVAAISCQNEFKALLSKDKIHFETGKAEIKQISYALLDNLYSVSKKCPKVIISIEGHTDSVGSNIDNQALSEKRAKAVKDYFIKKGVDAKKLIAVGHGEAKPIGNNFVKDGRAKNRRIEYIIKGVK
jgi:outer membrane protein OmpA-like peptidoglycan-associated protein/osmotically-inducible protein OsmY